MDIVSDYPIRRFQDGRARGDNDPVVNETRIELVVNDDQLRLAMLCLPRNLEALAVGFLMGEGALRDAGDLESVEVLAEARKVLVRGDFDADALDGISLRWTWGTGCGSGGTGRDMDAPAFGRAPAGPTVTADQLGTLAADFHSRTDLWRKTGGVHACALAEPQRILYLADDVGRHNALDKVIGMSALDGVERSDKLVIATGRLSAEIVSKAVACGVGLLASRSAVTGLAVELARRFGVTLVGFLRGRRMNVYTGYHRVVEAGA